MIFVAELGVTNTASLGNKLGHGDYVRKLDQAGFGTSRSYATLALALLFVFELVTNLVWFLPDLYRGHDDQQSKTVALFYRSILQSSRLSQQSCNMITFTTRRDGICDAICPDQSTIQYEVLLP